MGKVLILISTEEKQKALTGIMYAANAIKNGWLDDVKVYFMGPIEKVLAEDEEFQKMISQIFEYITPVACKRVSDNHGVTEHLEKLGYKMEYIGKMISDDIKKGYTPMVF
ncbi:MAG: hypothetical protein H0Z32_14170 [Bacillaceae bacterium]|nr:hypothetical protein [Bacillaceae bacterium]